MTGPLLYLDFDGVLHYHDVRFHPLIGPYLSAPPEGAVLFQHMDVLRDLLAPYLQVNIVLSTSWAYRFGYVKAKRQLHPDLRQRVIGSIYPRSTTKAMLRGTPRGQWVVADVKRRSPSAGVAMDDDAVCWLAR